MTDALAPIERRVRSLAAWSQLLRTPTWLGANVALLWMLLLPLAGCVVPPGATVGCVQNADCPGGVCQAGYCVEAPADTVQPEDVPQPAEGVTAGDAAHDGGVVTGTDGASSDGDGGQNSDSSAVAQQDGAVADVDAPGADAEAVPCTDVTDCLPPGAVAQPCVDVSCSQGVCKFGPQPLGSSCTTTGPCSTDGVCTTTGCTSTGSVCDDGQPCTLDVCTLAGCKHVGWPDGTTCGDPALPCKSGTCASGVCELGLQPGACLIDGKCWSAGDRLAASGDASCWVCEPATNSGAWVPIPDAPCDDGEPCTAAERCNDAAQCKGDPTPCPSGGPCHVSSCVAGVGCVMLKAVGPCTDGDPCTVQDACQDGSCVGQLGLSCSDGNPCTADACTAGAGCVHTPVDGPCTADNNACTQDQCVKGACLAVPLASVCQIGGACLPAGASAPGTGCLFCDPAQSTTSWSPRTGGPCDDDNACTQQESCESGSCVAGGAVDCDDNNPCTSDTCAAAVGCVHAPLAVACDDGNPCTSADTCASGTCSGSAQLAALLCEDGNPCTADQCHPVLGCSHAPAEGLCDDGVSCTLGEHCLAGQCDGGQFICACGTSAACNDGDPCTDDSCNSGWCAYVPANGPPCDDGDACTGADICLEGECVGLALTTCDDGDPCTADGCVADVGCWSQSTPGAACDDASLCTTADICTDTGQCIGIGIVCDDGNECTADVCDPVTAQCAHVGLTDGTACADDGVACSLDRCMAGSCDHTAVAPQSCWIDGVCRSAGSAHPFQPCLACLPQVAQQVWSAVLGLPCQDGNACTGDDSCGPSGVCAGEVLPCDDDNPCTTSVCNPLASDAACQHIQRNGPCSDGDGCTTADLCVSGSCLGVPADCDDHNPCTIDLCGAKSGCVYFAGVDGAACADDGIACTRDECAAGACAHPVSSGSCLVDGACVPAGAGSALLPCVVCQPALEPLEWSPASAGACTDGNVCTVGDSCAGGSCVGQPSSGCDDGNPCTVDGCDAVAGCAHVPASTGSCDDGDVCTTGDICAAGACVGAPVNCAEDAGSCGFSWCDSALGCRSKVRCGPLEACIDGLCLTATGGVPGPVAIEAPLQSGALGAPSLLWTPQLSTDAETPVGPELATLWLAARTAGCNANTEIHAPLVGALDSGAAQVAWQSMANADAIGCSIDPVLQAAPDGALLYWGSSGGECSPGLRALRVAPLDALAQADAIQTGPCVPAPAFEYPAVLLSSSAPWRWLVAATAGLDAWIASPVGLSDAQKQTLAGEQPQEPIAIAPDWLAGAAIGPELVLTRAAASDNWRPPTLWQAGAILQPLVPDAILAPAGLASAPTLDSVSAAWDGEHGEVVVALGGRMQAADGVKYFVALARLSTITLQPVVAELVTQIPADEANAPLRALRVVALTGPKWPDRTALLAFSTPAGGPLYLARAQQLTNGSLTVSWPWPIANVLGANDTPFGHGELSELRIAPDGSRFAIAFAVAGQLKLWTLPL